jgi:hypothetical protein
MIEVKSDTEVDREISSKTRYYFSNREGTGEGYWMSFSNKILPQAKRRFIAENRAFFRKLALKSLK